MKKTILLVEDEESDILFMQMALQAEGVDNPLAITRDGREALAYLQGQEQYADRQKYPLPSLVLLDLRLPYVPGLEVLQWLRQQPSFAHLPVLVLSTSNQDADVEAAYGLGANAYLVKPPLLSELQNTVRLIKRYWLDRDAPPPGCPDWQALIVPRPHTVPPERRK